MRLALSLLVAAAVVCWSVSRIALDPRAAGPETRVTAKSEETQERGARSSWLRLRRRGRAVADLAAAAVEPAADAALDAPEQPPSPAEAPLTEVFGVVLGYDGRPSAWAEVFVLGSQVELGTRGKLGRGVAGADGSFRIRLESGGVVRCAAVAPQTRLSVGAWIVAAAGVSSDVGTIRLERGARLECRVVDASGEPVPDAWVRMSPADPADSEFWAAVAKPCELNAERCPEGIHVADWLPPGRYRVRASPPGQCPWWGADVIAETGVGPVTLRLPPEVSPRTTSVRVRAVDGEGRPVAAFDARLRAWGERTAASATDGEATVALREVPPFVLTVVADGFAPAEIVEIESRDEPYVVTLAPERDEPDPPGLVLRGVIESGGPTAEQRAEGLRFLVTATALAEGGGVSADCETDSDGSFALRVPAVGRYRVEASGDLPGDGVRASGVVVVEADETDVRIAVRPVAAIELGLALPGGVRADECWIDRVQLAPGGDTHVDRFEGPLSAVSLEGLRDDAAYRVGVSVRVADEWLRGVVLPCIVPGGPRVEVELERGAAIEGVVVRADGTPVAAAWVQTDAERPHMRSAVTDPQGRFRVTGLPEGWRRLGAWAPGLELADAVAAEAGGAAVTIVMPPALR